MSALLSTRDRRSSDAHACQQPLPCREWLDGGRCEQERSTCKFIHPSFDLPARQPAPDRIAVKLWPEAPLYKNRHRETVAGPQQHAAARACPGGPPGAPGWYDFGAMTSAELLELELHLERLRRQKEGALGSQAERLARPAAGDGLPREVPPERGLPVAQGQRTQQEESENNTGDDLRCLLQVRKGPGIKY